MIRTTFIQSEQTHHLRQTVLRPGRPTEEAIFEDDQLPTTFHIGVFENDQIVVISTFVLQSPPETLTKFLKLPTGSATYRLRGMATDSSARRKGYGKLAIQFAERELLAREVKLLWFNARQVAYPFYTILGYNFFGDEFEMSHIGPHKVMYKILKSDSL